MIIWVAKFGIPISLFLLAHALFYPNKFSLIIAILGYIIALISAVIYGLFRTTETLQEQKSAAESYLENKFKFSSKHASDLSPRMFPLPHQKLNIRPIIQALGAKEANEMFLKISSAEKLDDLDVFRESGWIKRIEDDKYIEDDIPGYQ